MERRPVYRDADGCTRFTNEAPTRLYLLFFVARTDGAVVWGF